MLTIPTYKCFLNRGGGLYTRSRTGADGLRVRGC